ncbi:sperm-associated antigen 17, partial [Clarias magur]
MASKRGKNERTGSAPVAWNRQWEGPLNTAVLHEESWDVCVSLVVCDSVCDEVCMRALCQAVQQPLRRLFTILSWENLLQKVNDLGNPKTRKIKELPAFYEVTEAAKSVLDSGDKLSVDLLTKLVKFQLLDIKSTDIQRRAAAQKVGQAPALVVPVKEKSDKGKKGTETPPPRKDTALKRRGDEVDVSYIDDEPDDGPQHYVLMTGFHQPSLISALDSVGVHVSSVIRLRSDRSQTPSTAQEEERDDTSEEHEFPAGASDLQQELGLFWDQLEDVLNSTGFQSRLSDVARLDYRADQNLLSRDLNNAQEMQEVGVAVFEGVACLLYDSLDWRRQHQHYLSSMRLIDVPDVLHTPVHKLRPDTPAEVLTHTHSSLTLMTCKPVCMCVFQAVPVKKRAELSSESECVVDVDMRLYSDLLDRLPVHCVSVPLILHCLIEQVASSETCGVPAQRESWSETELMPYVAQAVCGVSRGEQQDAELMEYFGHKEEDQRTDRSPALLHHHDERSKRLNHIHVLEGLDVVSAEVSVMKTSPLWNTLMSKHLDSCSLSAARRHELLHHCSTDSLSPADVQRFLQLCVFESMPLTAVDADGGHIPVVSHTVLPWDDPVTFTHTVYHGLNATHDSTAGCDEQQDNKVSAADLQKTLSRHFRHWNYSEHHSADVFPQVLQTVSEAYECVDSYLSSQSSVLYVVCHSPMSPERSSRGSWEVSVHTDVRFRSYLENVAESIRDWIRVEEEERRQQQQQQRQQQRQQRESETLDTAMKGVSPVSEVFIRNDSLKAWKMEKNRPKDEDVTKKTKKETKSSAKGGERAESTREEEHHTSPSGTESRSDTHLTHDTHERSDDLTHTEKQPVFTGYRMGGRLVQVRGETQSVYPSDGGQISVERVHYVQGSTQLKVCVKKDGHCFYTHITEPERQNTHGQSEKCGCFYAVLSNGLTLAYSHTHQDVDAQPLQLHVSLPTGLQIHFSFQHTEQGQAVLVRQSLPLSGFGFPATHTESSRTITCDGAVIRHMRDGSTA